MPAPHTGGLGGSPSPSSLLDDADAPDTFAELTGTSDPIEVCRFCGEPATHRLTLTARLRHARQGNKGTPPVGTPPTAAQHKQDYCEKHAVALFFKIRKAMK